MIKELPKGSLQMTLLIASRRRWAVPLIMMLLTGHFALIQLVTAVQFGDATRNLHWGLLTWEEPAFLIGAPDTFERNKGFVPDPPELAPSGEAGRPPSGLHRWWGPVTPLLFAGVWGMTRSYGALQLVIPLAAGAMVLLTYQCGRRLLGSRPALVAAIFLSTFPLFREYGTVSYNEPLGALLLGGALFAYLHGRTLGAVAIGALAALTKLDLVAVYFGTLVVCILYDRLWGARELPWQHHLAALLGPLLLAAPWIWLHYLSGGTRLPSSGLSPAMFALIAPQMFELVFFIPWYGSLLTFVIIGVPVVAGLRAHTLPPLARVLLLTWVSLGLLVTLVYCATPGAGNSARVFIPALPALALLFAAGFPQLPASWRRRTSFYLIALFTMINLVVIGYRTVNDGWPIRAAEPAFAALREYERGFVLTPGYWETILYARQRATWFEFDPAFERNIMGDSSNFVRYLTTHPIRYVLLPNAASPAAPEVLAYLDAHAEVQQIEGWTLWVLTTP